MWSLITLIVLIVMVVWGYKRIAKTGNANGFGGACFVYGIVGIIVLAVVWMVIGLYNLIFW